MKTIEELNEKYPNLFAKSGTHVPTGWVELVTRLLNSMGQWQRFDATRNANVTNLDFVQVHQIKEKFGELRFYFGIYDKPGDHKGEDMTAETLEYCRGMVDFAEYLSRSICQECGAVGKTHAIGGWHATLCDHHHEEAVKSRK